MKPPVYKPPYDSPIEELFARHAVKFFDENPAAVIPPRKNAAIWPDKTQAARARNDTVEACRRFGRRCWSSSVTTTNAAWLRAKCIAKR